MAFYNEFTNLTTDLIISSISEFDAAAVGTRVKRINGDIYVKNSDGIWDIDNQIPNLTIYDQNDNQIFP